MFSNKESENNFISLSEWKNFKCFKLHLISNILHESAEIIQITLIKEICSIKFDEIENEEIIENFRKEISFQITEIQKLLQRNDKNFTEIESEIFLSKINIDNQNFEEEENISDSNSYNLKSSLLTYENLCRELEMYINEDHKQTNKNVVELNFVKNWTQSKIEQMEYYCYKSLKKLQKQLDDAEKFPDNYIQEAYIASIENLKIELISITENYEYEMENLDLNSQVLRDSILNMELKLIEIQETYADMSVEIQLLNKRLMIIKIQKWWRKILKQRKEKNSRSRRRKKFKNKTNKKKSLKK